jgi:hypothetical protein
MRGRSLNIVPELRDSRDLGDSLPSSAAEFSADMQGVGRFWREVSEIDAGRLERIGPAVWNPRRWLA